MRPHVSNGNRRLLSFVATLVSLTIIFILLKISIMKEDAQKSTVIFTGSIPSSAIVKPPTNESMAAFLTSPSPIQAQSAVMDRSPIPLPRPRPKRP